MKDERVAGKRAFGVPTLGRSLFIYFLAEKVIQRGSQSGNRGKLADLVPRWSYGRS
jgi:hypothetical protein